MKHFFRPFTKEVMTVKYNDYNYLNNTISTKGPFMRQKLSNKGFSLIGVLVAAGILGLLMTATLRMIETQNIGMKYTETKSEMLAIANEITTILIDEKACAQTLSPLGDISGNSSLDIPQIVGKLGNARYVTGGVYGNKTARISSIKLKTRFDEIAKNYVAGNLPNPDVSDDATVEVIFTKESSLTNKSNLVRRFPVIIKTNAAGQVTTCYSTLEGAVDTARSRTCEDFGGVLVNISGVDICILQTITYNNTTGLQIGINTTGTFAPRVSIRPNGNLGIGTTAPTKTLEVNGDIKSNQVCIGNNCRTTFADQNCPAGSYVDKINKSGVASCMALPVPPPPPPPPTLPGVSCPNGQVLKGITDAGLPVCTVKVPSCRIVSVSGASPLYYSVATCNANEYLSGGGGKCVDGHIHNSAPKTLSSWEVDCFNGTFSPLTGSDAASTAYAICCLKD